MLDAYHIGLNPEYRRTTDGLLNLSYGNLIFFIGVTKTPLLWKN